LHGIVVIAHAMVPVLVEIN